MTVTATITVVAETDDDGEIPIWDDTTITPTDLATQLEDYTAADLGLDPEYADLSVTTQIHARREEYSNPMRWALRNRSIDLRDYPITVTELQLVPDSGNVYVHWTPGIGGDADE